jgi:hypothetical protein
MPYIKEQQKEYINAGECPSNPGELNYLISSICKKYLDNNKKSYQTFNDIIGALECCKQEFYRRLIGPYEDIKIKENGDVF